MSSRQILVDVFFLITVFFLLSTVMLVVNLATHTAKGLSGNALATVLAAIMMARYRWQGRPVSWPKKIQFAFLAGACAVAYLYVLYFYGKASDEYVFARLQWHELITAFTVNTLVFGLVLQFIQRKSVKQRL